MVSYVPEIRLHMRPKDDDHMPARHAEPFQVHFRDRTDGEAWTFNLSRRDLAKLVKEGQRLLRRRSTRKKTLWVHADGWKQ